MALVMIRVGDIGSAEASLAKMLREAGMEDEDPVDRK